GGARRPDRPGRGGRPGRRPSGLSRFRSASFRKERNLVGMPTSEEEGARALTLVELVRCLSCRAVYSKPAGGGTGRENPGCPVCGYVGWVMVRDGSVGSGLLSSREPTTRAARR